MTYRSKQYRRQNLCPGHPHPHDDTAACVEQTRATQRVGSSTPSPSGERRRLCCSGEVPSNGLELNGMCAAPGPWSSSVFPVESQDSMSVPSVVFGAGGGAQVGVEAAAGEVCSEATSGWTRRGVPWLAGWIGSVLPVDYQDSMSAPIVKVDAVGKAQPSNDCFDWAMIGLE
ncbi:uncharacterized protein LOC119280127 [Triticum dicoccoides]|uniref:uncharacterized protein LOC119280127 n=1 Tax=Triticum dicoccoides TaxID=85692 RepID=UPI00188E4116|nr:uncharacterized protein LOC119280127 [Triticum dicoccoides]